MELHKITNSKLNNVNQTKVNKINSNDKQFSSYLGETKSLDSIFEEAAQKYNVSVDLLKAVGKAESGFDTKAVSRSGAQGVMQLMPGTAKELGVKDSFDPEQNIMGGAKYISQMLKKYDGDVKLSLAAYNAGSGNVAKYNGIPPFKETQNYVVKVMGYMKEGVSTGNAKVSVASTNSNITSSLDTTEVLKLNVSEDQQDLAQVMDSIFSYEDYKKFLEKLLMGEDDKNEKEKDLNYLASKSLSYNMAVMNIINN